MIGDFDSMPKDEQFDPFSVVLFKALQIIAFLFFIVLLAIKPEAKEQKTTNKAEFRISATWPDGSPDDVDLFVQDPVDNVVWYRRREAGFLVLERDDRGGLNDFTMVNGEKVQTATREEVATMRSIIPGEYTVNVYLFTAQSGHPVPVTVTVEKLNPNTKVVLHETVTLDNAGMEKTAVRFVLDSKGEIVDTNRDEKPIVQAFKKQRGIMGDQ